MKLLHKVGVIFALCLASTPHGAATRLGAFAEGYMHHVWRTQDGLPDQTVQALAQTPDGYLWIGTKAGLVRFDGARFVVYDQTDAPGLTDSSINCLFVSRDGSLWIGTEGGGVVRLHDGVFRAVPTSDGGSDSFIRSIFQDRRGVMWVGGDQGLFQVRGFSLQRLDSTASVPSIFVRAIVEDALGQVWVGGTTLLCFDGARVTEHPLPGGPSVSLVTAMLADREGKIWVATLTGLHTLLPSGELHPVSSAFGTIQSLKQSDDGGLWIGTLGRGVFKYDHGSLTNISAEDVLPSNTILAMLEDSEHDLWIGTQAGVVRLSLSPVSMRSFPEVENADAGDSPFESLYQDHDGSVWAASRHLFHTHAGRLRSETLPGLPQVRVRTLLRDRNGELWVGTDGGGLYHLTPTGEQHYTHLDDLANDFIRVILQARDGSFWLGTDGGVSHLWQGKFVNYNTPQGLSYFSITAMLEDRAGDVWVGTSRGLNRIHKGMVLKDATTNALQSQKIWSIHEDSEGGLWFGTSNGLYSLHGNRLTRYTRAQGLASDIVYQVLEDDAGRLWLGGPHDVTCIARHALEASATPNDRRTPAFTIYPISQDFESVELSAGIQPAAFIDRQHSAWFASNKGPVQIPITPNSAQAPKPINIVIDQVVTDGRERSVASSLTLEPNDRRLEISFAAILLRSQEALRYRYRLEGFDPEWSEPTTRRVATYTNLPAGHYQFRVTVYEVDHPAQISKVSLKIEQRPHFYRTLWFALVCLLLAILLALALHYYRLRQVGMRFQSVLQERNRLAREMHDTLIQDCTSVSALLEAVSSMDFADKMLSHQLLDHARDQVRTSIDEARNAVWDIRHEETTEQDLSAAVCRMVSQMSERGGIAMECSMIGKAFSVPSRIRREILMIVREALFNAQMHAQPRRIDVRMSFREHDFTIDVEDDGVGFDYTALPGDDAMHYGLIGMRERAQRLGGELQIEMRSSSGTAVRIHLPRRLRET